MKRILIPTLALSGCAMVLAQTNDVATNEVAAVPTTETISAVATNAPTVIETHIYSDTVEFGIETRSAVYRGNVRLEDPRIHLTCEQLTADVPEEGERVEQVIAETNVVIIMLDERGLTNRAYADKAVYTYQATDAATNETVELTGGPETRIERPEVVWYGSPIIWDRVKGTLGGKNRRMIYRGEDASSTNAATADPLRRLRQDVKTENSESNSLETGAPTNTAPVQDE